MTKELSIEALRAETPGCGKVIHLNNAGAGLMPEPVLRAITGHLELEAEIGGYEAADLKADELEGAYDTLARFLNCDRDEVAFIENATRAWDMAFYSIPFQSGDRILTAQAEYVSNYMAYLQVRKRHGVQIEVIPNDEHGQVSVDALRDMLDDRVKLVAITHAPTNGGLLNPAMEIGRVTRAAGVLYLLDACQSVGQMPIDVAAIGCDMLSATGRKYLRGPRGTGFLYVRRNLIGRLEPPFVDLHAADWTSVGEYRLRADARRFENWETNFAGKLGLKVALEYALALGLDAIRRRVRSLADTFRAQLSDIEGVHVADDGAEKSGIVTFHVDGIAANDVKLSLRESAVNVSASDLAIARLDLEARNLPSLVRASVHYYNTHEELDRACELIRSLAAG